MKRICFFKVSIHQETEEQKREWLERASQLSSHDELTERIDFHSHATKYFSKLQKREKRISAVAKWIGKKASNSFVRNLTIFLEVGHSMLYFGYIWLFASPADRFESISISEIFFSQFLSFSKRCRYVIA
jgi:hypothetical protein